MSAIKQMQRTPRINVGSMHRSYREADIFAAKFERTNDRRWLERARAALEAAESVRAALAAAEKD